MPPFLFHVIATTLMTAWAPANAGAQNAAQTCSLNPIAGVQQRLISNGQPRTYRLFVPRGFDARTRLPLVLDLHGSGGTAAGQARTSGFEGLAAREGFVVATLQAQGSLWNVPVRNGRPDDVAYVSDVIDDVASRACIDSAKVYAAGFSGGGRMSSLLACRLNTRIAAIAPMAGLRWPGPCDGRAVPVLTLHGLADPQNTYDGHAIGRGAEWSESIPDALAGWARHIRCKPDVIVDDPPGPLSTIRYDGCADGAEVRLIRIDDFPHDWARDEIDATAAMWEFFKAHALRR